MRETSVTEGEPPGKCGAAIQLAALYHLGAAKEVRHRLAGEGCGFDLDLRLDMGLWVGRRGDDAAEDEQKEGA